MLRHFVSGDDDSVELRAVRAFLADEYATIALDHADAVPSIPTIFPVLRGDSSTISDTKKTVQVQVFKPRKINASRERMKKEIATLRQQAIALEERLGALQRGEGMIRQEDNVLVVAWRTAAQDQRTQRQDAEDTYERLRVLIRNNKRAINRLRRYLHKMNIPIIIPTIPTMQLTEFEVSTGFQQVGHQLDMMYDQIELVFQDEQLDGLIDRFQNLCVKNDTTPDMAVEMRNSALLPFDVDTTANAMWTIRHKRASFFSADADEVLLSQTKDSIRRRFTISIPLQNFDGLLHGISKARRFKQGDRHVILYCARITRSSRVELLSTTDLPCFLCTWALIQPRYNAKPATIGQPMSQIQSLEVVKPIVPTLTVNENETSATALRDVRDLFVEGLPILHRLERQAVENMLLDMSTRKS